MRGREIEARYLLARLTDAPINSEEVDAELTNIKDALEAQSRGGEFKMRELFQNGPSQNLRRTLLGIAAQFFQQISGINLIVSHRLQILLAYRSGDTGANEEWNSDYIADLLRNLRL